MGAALNLSVWSMLPVAHPLRHFDRLVNAVFDVLVHVDAYPQVVGRQILVRHHDKRVTEDPLRILMHPGVINVARVIVIVPLVDLRAELRLLLLLAFYHPLWVAVVHVAHRGLDRIVVGKLIQLVWVRRDEVPLLTLHLLFSQKLIVLLVCRKCLAILHDLLVILLGLEDLVVLLLERVILVFDYVAHLLLRLLNVGAPSSRPAFPSVKVVLIISLR